MNVYHFVLVTLAPTGIVAPAAADPSLTRAPIALTFHESLTVIMTVPQKSESSELNYLARARTDIDVYK